MEFTRRRRTRRNANSQSPTPALLVLASLQLDTLYTWPVSRGVVRLVFGEPLLNASDVSPAQFRTSDQVASGVFVVNHIVSVTFPTDFADKSALEVKYTRASGSVHLRFKNGTELPDFSTTSHYHEDAVSDREELNILQRVNELRRSLNLTELRMFREL